MYVWKEFYFNPFQNRLLHRENHTELDLDCYHICRILGHLSIKHVPQIVLWTKLECLQIHKIYMNTEEAIINTFLIFRLFYWTRLSNGSTKGSINSQCVHAPPLPPYVNVCMVYQCRLVHNHYIFYMSKQGMEWLFIVLKQLHSLKIYMPTILLISSLIIYTLFIHLL